MITENTQNESKESKIKRQTLKEKVLMALINVGKSGLTTDDAGSKKLNFYTYDLSNYISKLKLQHGITAERKKAPKLHADHAPYLIYWLSDDDMPKAKKLVNHWRVIRGEKPLYEVAENA